MKVAGLSAGVWAGQAAYRGWTLPCYDLVVFGVNCPFAWRIPVAELLALFERNLAGEHLDVGVGTGYLLDRCRKPAGRQAITLADLNPQALRCAARRLARYEVVAVRADALEPLPLPAGAFGSASVNFLLHCLPGPMAAKARVLDHVAACVRPGGRVFGATVLSAGVPVGAFGRAELALFNAVGVFHNRGDGPAGLRAELAARFPVHRVQVRGCVALFEAQVP
ncbi:class I SAM-dependent methyltransferase [Kitasatospora aureofaciens]|uniref:class I SAM-dependent methyltransferase n=1 Tax=Kitasatospora aureofaciens TaxID=1894 RepID=UPI003826BEE2